MVNNWPAVGSVVEEKVSFLKRRDKHIFIYHLESHKPDRLPRKTAMLSVSIGFLMIDTLGGTSEIEEACRAWQPCTEGCSS